MSDKKREEFLKSLQPPTKEQVGGEIDYSNVFFNASLQSEIYKRNNPDDSCKNKDKHPEAHQK